MLKNKSNQNPGMFRYVKRQNVVPIKPVGNDEKKEEEEEKKKPKYFQKD
jgi:hypothetical protein